MIDILARYVGGEHDAVYHELVTTRRTDAVAQQVAEAMMRRVRRNLEELANRWWSHGFRLRRPFAEAGESTAVPRVESTIGRLPPALRTFYQLIGFVDFVEPPPGPPWPDVEEFDPIRILGSERLEAITSPDSSTELPLFDDNLHKFGIAGVGPVSTRLTDGFDATLYFEGEPLLVNDSVLRFVPYLRMTILERGGIGPFGAEEVDPDLVKDLTENLVPF